MKSEPARPILLLWHWHVPREDLLRIHPSCFILSFSNQHLEPGIFLKAFFFPSFPDILGDAISTCRSKDKWNSSDVDFGALSVEFHLCGLGSFWFLGCKISLYLHSALKQMGLGDFYGMDAGISCCEGFPRSPFLFSPQHPPPTVFGSCGASSQTPCSQSGCFWGQMGN